MKTLIAIAIVAAVTVGAAYAADTAKAPAMTMDMCKMHMKDGKMSDMPKDMKDQCHKMMNGSMMSGGSMSEGSMMMGSASSSSSSSASSSMTPAEHAGHNPQ